MPKARHFQLDAYLAAEATTNRYFEDRSVYPAHLTQDFNRSFVIEPNGKAVGAILPSEWPESRLSLKGHTSLGIIDP